MRERRTILINLAKAAILFTLASWALFLGVLALMHGRLRNAGMIATASVVLFPDGLAAVWAFRALSRDQSKAYALKLSIAFAVVAPLVLAVGHVTGTLVGGYTEVLLGSRFILPAIAAFVLSLMMVVIPFVVTAWVAPQHSDAK